MLILKNTVPQIRANGVFQSIQFIINQLFLFRG